MVPHTIGLLCRGLHTGGLTSKLFARQLGDISLLAQVIFKLAQKASISGIFSPPFSDGRKDSIRFILSGFPLHKKLNDILLSFVNKLLSTSGHTMATWLSFDRADDLMVVILPIGVRFLYNQHLKSLSISSILF